MKVLVVDDNATSRVILQEMLESFTFAVTCAASGAEGITELEGAAGDDPFELIVMDWKMPGMDGIEASRRIKDHKTLAKIPPIILVTAYGGEEVRRKAEEAGLEGFLLKPVSASMLFDAIMQASGEAVPETSRITQRREQEAEALKHIRGAQLLLVEDNEINQQVAQEILAGAGMKVTVASNGREAVNAVKENSYDAVLMDVQMPVMDGYTATRKIREWELEAQSPAPAGLKTAASSEVSASNLQPQTSGIPIIAMTAHAMAGDDQKSLDAGMNDHVTKPIDPDKLFATLQKWINPAAERTVASKRLFAAAGSPVPHAPAAAEPAAPVDDALPESLPGFDLAAGLARLMGNKRLYRKLLLDFGANYGGIAGEIRAALAAGDFERSHSLVHDLKGLAGNLEARELQAAAVAMEALVKGRAAETAADQEINRAFADLESALDRALAAVKNLGSAAEDTSVESGYGAGPSSIPDLDKKVVDRISAAVELGDVMQIKSIAEGLLSGSGAAAPFCNRLILLADDFDLDGIKNLLVDLTY
jgi:CheY-like chemotaxis protein